MGHRSPQILQMLFFSFVIANMYLCNLCSSVSELEKAFRIYNNDKKHAAYPGGR